MFAHFLMRCKDDGHSHIYIFTLYFLLFCLSLQYSIFLYPILFYLVLSYLILSYLISSTPHLSLSWTGISKIKMQGWWCSIGWVGKRWYHRLIFSKRKLLIKWRDKIENFKLHLHQSRSNLRILGKPPFYLISKNSLLLSFIFFDDFQEKRILNWNEIGF